MEKNAEAVQLDSQLSQQKLTVLATRFYTIYHVVLSNGEYDKTLQVIWLNQTKQLLTIFNQVKFMLFIFVLCVAQ